ncbi:MAG: ATP-binding cassette domain-containing protein [Planctomycetaceae bacterium]|nr:ATP-binding cassette domain-containing protein [Planctomycetaceae bacterium]
MNLGRIWKYVLPQWPRVIILIISITMVSSLFALSFLTIIPILKVMMSPEGLHGWIDRSSCEWRYGTTFYMPDITHGQESIYGLRVQKLAKKSLAEKAGLRPDDIIVSIEDFNSTAEANQPAEAKQPYMKILEKLATMTGNDSICLNIQRLINGELSACQIAMAKPNAQMYDKAGFIDRISWAGKWFASEQSERIAALLPRDNSNNAKKEAGKIIIYGMLIVTLFRCFFTFIQKYYGAKVMQVATANLREEMFTHSMHMNVGHFTSYGTSDSISRMIGDVGGIGKGIKVFLGKDIQEPMKAFFMLIVAFMLNWKLTLIFITAAPAVMFIFSTFGRKVRKYARRSLQGTASLLGKLQESISSLKVVKVYNRQQYETDKYTVLSRKQLKQTLRLAKVDSATRPLLDFLGMIVGAVALYIGIVWVTNNDLDPTSFFMILIALGVAAESVRKTSDIWNQIQDCNAAADRVFQLLDTPAESEKTNAVTLGQIKKQIDFKNIVFTYPGYSEPVLRDFSLTVQAGHNIAVVGPNGSGKTTLVNLLPRFYNPDSGAILMDGVDIKDCSLKSLRDQIAMVTQNVVTFNDTVAANIRYGNLNATMDEVITAAKRAYVHEFIEPLPDGYNTIIGENGSGFSGGQLQRIAIARAIVKNPSILIFDEAMSQVDADSEAKIQKALEEIMRGRTSFVIAHRFSTVVSADKIVVMNHGRIAAQGTHAELVKTSGLYKSLYETQLMGK